MAISALSSLNALEHGSLGVMLCLEAATRTFLVYHLSTAHFMLISPFVLYGFLGATMVWTLWYARYTQRNSRQRNAQAA